MPTERDTCKLTYGFYTAEDDMSDGHSSIKDELDNYYPEGKMPTGDTDNNLDCPESLFSPIVVKVESNMLP